MNTDPSDLIRNAKFFSELSEPACGKLARLSHRKTVPKRDILFMEGAKGDAVYLLVSGSIQLVKTSMDGKETVIKTVKEGELFAEVILFEKPRYPVTAIARTEAEVIELPRAGFLKLLDEPEFRNDFMAMLMAKQRYLAERIQQLTTTAKKTSSPPTCPKKTSPRLSVPRPKPSAACCRSSKNAAALNGQGNQFMSFHLSGMYFN